MLQLDSFATIKLLRRIFGVKAAQPPFLKPGRVGILISGVSLSMCRVSPSGRSCALARSYANEFY